MSLSTGLKGFYNMIEGDNPDLAYDLTLYKNHIPITNVPYTADGIHVNANGEYGLLNNTDNLYVNSTAGTIIMKFKSDSPMTDGELRIIFGGIGNFYVFKSSGNYLRFFINDGISARIIDINPDKLPNWESGTQIVIQWSTIADIFNSERMVFNVDGNYVIPDLSISADALNEYVINTPLGILNHTASGQIYPANGALEYMSLFSRVLSSDELALTNTNHNLIIADYFKKVVGNYNIPIIY